MNNHDSNNAVPWILSGPQKRVEIRVPERLLDLFDSQHPVRATALINLIIMSLGDLTDIANYKAKPSRNPSHWHQKDQLLRDAILLKIVETLQSGSMDPNHFDQLIRLCFNIVDEL